MRVFTRWSRRFHRWLAYGLGAIVGLWVVTGVVMMFPPAPTIRATPNPPIDPARAVRSPSEAARALPGTEPKVRGVTLRQLGGRLAYVFALANGSQVFIDAATTERVEFGDSLALVLARRAMLDTTIAHSASRITAYDAQYRFGPLPAYRVTLDDAALTLIHVAADGSVTATSQRSRLRSAMAALHEFQVPGGGIPQRLRKATLLGASTLTIILALTGYVLALPRRWRR